MLIIVATLLYKNIVDQETDLSKKVQVTEQQNNTEEDSPNNWETLPDYSEHHTFHKAFLIAREELGSGKEFKWNYNIYTTNHEGEQ